MNLNLIKRLIFLSRKVPQTKKYLTIWELERNADLLFYCFCAMMITANLPACL